MKTFRLLSHIFALVALLSSQHAAAQTYHITDLGPLDGAPTFATAINENGVIAGYSQTGETSARAWIWVDGVGFTDVGSFGGADNRAFALGVDDKLYGYSQNGAGVQRGFLWDGSVLADLGSLAPGDAVNPEAVNAGGTIVGTTTTGGNQVAFMLTSGTMALLPALAGAPLPASSAAYDVNDTGRIVGVANWIYGGTRAFITDAGGALASLGTLGANDSTATAINTSAQVVGHSVTVNNETHAVIFAEGVGMKDLGVLPSGHDSRAWGINDDGDAVGTAENSAGQPRAVLWMNGGVIVDLNASIPPNAGWVLEEARDVNNAGDIVGYGTIGGQQHAFLLERYSGPDTEPPVAVATVTPPTYNGATSTTVVVKFWDHEKVVADTTHTVGTIRIKGPNLYDAAGTAFMWYSTDRQTMDVSFNVPAPGGTWDPTDNGTYEVHVTPNRVSDLAGNLMPDTIVATFSVGIQTSPTLGIAGLPASTTVGTPVNLIVTATSSFPSSAGDVLAFSIDWDGDGSDVQTVNGPTGTVIPHTFTSIGTRTVRMRATDPHGVLSTEHTASVTVNNTAAPLIASEVLDTEVSNISAGSSVVVQKAGTAYFFGAPFVNENTSAVTWSYLTTNPFSAPADLDNGPIYFAGGGVDGRNRIVLFGGHEAEGGARSSGMVYPGGGGVGALPVAILSGPTSADAARRLYIFSGALYRYDAGASGNGTWSTFATPAAGFAPTCMSFDGVDRIIVCAGTTVRAFNVNTAAWTQLANAPVVFTRATLGADGLIYLLSGTQVWTFDPVLNTFAQVGTTTYAQNYAPQFLGTDGYLYFVGGDGIHIERFDTRPTTTLFPRIASAATGTTLVQGTPWTYTISASGKPRPTFSLVHGPSGMTVDVATGVVSWTPSVAQAGAQTAVVRATNSAGFAEQMITFNVLSVAPDTTPPAAPANVLAFNITTSAADISWNASTDNIAVTGYGIYEKRTSGNRWHRRTYYYQLGSTTGTSWHTPTLPMGSSKTYYVAAKDAAGNLSAYAPVTVNVLSTPSLYSSGGGLTAGKWAIVAEAFTSHTFTALANPLPVFTVVNAPTGAVWHSTATNAGYFTWTPVAGQEGDATFTLTATNSAGSATQSFGVHVYPQGTDLIPPSAPSSLVVDLVSWDSCRVTWGAATDNYGVVEYRVTASHRAPRSRFHRGPYNDHVVTFTVPPTTLQSAITDLRASTSYNVLVQARDAAGLWGYASSRAIVTLPQPFVLAESKVTTTANPDGSTTMTWPGYGYYWKFSVESSIDLVTWLPIEPASQWPNYITTFIFTPEPGVPAKFYRVKATPASAP